MAKRKVIWSKNAKHDILDIMLYYKSRNKSMIYSSKLYSDIKKELKNLNFSVAIPQETNIENLFYFIYKHVSVFFSIQNSDIIVKFIIDDRRSPELIKRLLRTKG